MRLNDLFGHIADKIDEWRNGPSFLRETWTTAQAERNFENLVDDVLTSGKREITDGDRTLVVIPAQEYERMVAEKALLDGMTQG